MAPGMLATTVVEHAVDQKVGLLWVVGQKSF